MEGTERDHRLFCGMVACSSIIVLTVSLIEQGYFAREIFNG